jgi:multicomponent Na+:H+ antiporter subunit B
MSVIKRVAGRWITLPAFAYAICLVLTGHLSPGGGFAGGVVVGLIVALLTSTFEVGVSAENINPSTAHFGRVLGLLCLLALGTMAMVVTGFFLKNFPPRFAGPFSMAGLIVPLYVCIGVIVGYETSLIVYYLFERRPGGE